MRLGYLLIYLMASMLPFGKSIIAVVLALLIVYDIAVYFKPRKIWGKRLFLIHRTHREKVGLAILTTAVVFMLVFAFYSGRWQENMWMETLMMLLCLISAYLPNQVYENGFRCAMIFEFWNSVESIEEEENHQIKIVLKNPNIRKNVSIYCHPEEKGQLEKYILERIEEQKRAKALAAEIVSK